MSRERARERWDRDRDMDMDREMPWRPSEGITDEWRRRTGRKERDWESSRRRGEEDLHVICVDDLKESERAMKFALKNIPRDHRMLLVHGRYESAMDRKERMSEDELRDRYMRMCKKNGMKCEFRSFDYRSNRDFGDKVCTMARRNGARSVVIGKRDDVSDMRRTIVGSSSQAVLSSCGLPVTVVQSEAHASWM